MFQFDRRVWLLVILGPLVLILAGLLLSRQPVPYQLLAQSDGDLVIIIVNGDKEPQQLTSTKSIEDDAVWVPGRDQIIFVANTDGDYDIYLLDLYDPDQVGPPYATLKLLDTTDNEQSPVVSPDGRWVAYSNDVTGVFQIYIMPLGGDEPAQLTFSGHYNSPVWSPDGKRLAFHGSETLAEEFTTDVYIFELDTKKLMPLTSTPNLLEAFPRWSPDGQQVSFIRFDEEGTKYYLVPTSGGEPREVQLEEILPWFPEVRPAPIE